MRTTFVKDAMLRKLIIATLLILGGVGTTPAASAETYPNRPIQLVIPYDPGTGSDLIGRLVAELAQEHLGVKITIANKPGGGGAPGSAFVKNAKPDGYLIGIVTSALVAQKVYGTLPFDHHDMEVVILFHSSPSVLCVPASSKYTSFKEVIEDAKAHPGDISWATGSGNLLTCSRDIFHHAGVEFKVLPSKGGGLQPAIQASGGHVDMSFTNILEAKPQIDAGLLRPLAVYAKERIESLPAIPTFEEYGYPVRCLIVRGIMTPPGVDREKLEILNNAFTKAVASDRYKEFVARNEGIVMSVSFEDAVELLDEQQKTIEEVAQQ